MQGIRNILTATFAVAYLIGASGEYISPSNYTCIHSDEHRLESPDGRAVHSLNSLRIFQKTKPSALSFPGGFCSNVGIPVLWSISQFHLNEVSSESTTHSVAIYGRAPPLVRRLA